MSPSQVPDIAAALDVVAAHGAGRARRSTPTTRGGCSRPAARGSRSSWPTSIPTTSPSRSPAAELERLAAEHGAEIAVHRDASRSFYLEAPGDARLEVIAYPDVLEEDSE